MFSQLIIFSLLGSTLGFTGITQMLTSALVSAVILALISVVFAALLSAIADSKDAFKYIALVIFLLLVLVQLTTFNITGTVLSLI